MNYAIRVTLPYESFKDIVSKWASRCVSFIAAQHDADAEVSQTHVHLVAFGCEVKPEALRRMWPDAPGSGNGFWSMKDYYEKDDKKYPVDEGAIVYILKGKLNPVFVKNISQATVEKSRQEWVEPVKAAKTGDNSEYVVSELVKKFNIVKESRYWRDEDEIEFGQCKYNLSLLFDVVRSTTWKFLWGQKRMSPHASHYKIIACSVFMRICENANCFDEGMSYVMEKWY